LHVQPHAQKRFAAIELDRHLAGRSAKSRNQICLRNRDAHFWRCQLEQDAPRVRTRVQQAVIEHRVVTITDRRDGLRLVRIAYTRQDRTRRIFDKFKVAGRKRSTQTVEHVGLCMHGDAPRELLFDDRAN
jgi:hypothetical protein